MKKIHIFIFFISLINYFPEHWCQVPNTFTTAECSQSDINMVSSAYNTAVSNDGPCQNFTQLSSTSAAVVTLDACPAMSQCAVAMTAVLNDPCLEPYANSLQGNALMRIAICRNFMLCTGFDNSSALDLGEGCDGNPNADGFTTSLIIGAIVCVLVACAFGFIRPIFKTYFLPKALSGDDWSPDTGLRYHFQWIWEVITYSEDDFLRQTGGVDALGHLTFLKYSTFLISILTFFGLVVLLPINASGANEDEDPDDVQFVVGLDVLTISNIRINSSFLFAHLISIYGFSILTYLFMYLLYKKYCEFVLRAGIKDDTINRTVLVRNFPENLVDPKDLSQYFCDLHGKDIVVHAIVIPESGELYEVSKMREKKYTNWKVHQELLEKNGVEETLKTGKIFSKRPGCFGEEQSAIDYYEEEIKALDEKMDWLRKSDTVPTNNGLIVFDSVRNASKCAQSLHEFDSNRTKISATPHPADINWSHFDREKSSKYCRVCSSWTLIGLFFLFWLVPVTFFQALANVSTLRQVGLDFLADIVEANDTARSLFEDTLPSLGVTIVLALAPLVFKLALKLKSHPFKSEFEREVANVYWAFLVVNVLLASVIAGSLFGVADQIATDPSQVLTSLGISLPGQSTFFINYIIIEGFIAVPILLLRFPDVALQTIKTLILCRLPTKTEKERINKPVPFDYAILTARSLLIFNITQVFSTMAPLILPFGLIYFVISWFITKYNMVYVYNHKFTDIRLVPSIITRIGIGLILYQAVMLAVFGLKEFPAGALSLLLVPVTLSYLAWLHRRFVKQARFIPLVDCPSSSETSWHGSDEDLFVHPAYKIPEDLEMSKKRVGMKLSMSKPTDEISLQEPEKEDSKIEE